MPIKKPINKQLFYVRLILSCTILLYLITLIEFDRVIFLLPKLRVEYIWQPFCLLLLTNLILGIRWSFMLSRFEIKQSLLDSWRYYLVGGFYGIMLPGVIGGDVVRLALSIKYHGRSKALITTSVFFERACGIVVILLMASFAAFFVPILLENDPSIISLIYGISLGVLVLFILFFLILKVSSSSRLDTNRYHDGWKQQMVELFVHFRKLSVSSLSIFLLLSILAHLIDILGCFILSKALLLDQPFSIFLLIMPLVYVFTTLPISIGGVGVREGVLTFFMVKVGAVASDAVLLALLIYLNRVLVSLIGGIIQFLDKQRSAELEKHENLP